MRLKKIFFIAISYVLFLVFHSVISAQTYKLGIENLQSIFISQLASKKVRIGLITNQTGRDQKGQRNIEILCAHGLSLTHILVPEHGFEGKVLAEKEVNDNRDERSQLPIVSLYGKGTGKKINAQIMEQIDLLMFDIQDSGMRHYTYISTMFRAMEAAAKYNKQIIVLDRPNPLGVRMEGPLVQNDLVSFISIAPIPLRHGMTVGELALYFNSHIMQKKVDLKVIPMDNYDRRYGMCNKLPQPLSPNIQTIQSSYGYSFLGLLGEVKPFDVAVGTEYAFQCIMLPKEQKIAKSVWDKLKRTLAKHNITSAEYGYYNERKKTFYQGLRLHFGNSVNNVPAFSTFITVLELFKNHGVALTFSPMFNKSVGVKEVQQFFTGDISKSILVQKIASELRQFYQMAKDVFIYKPYPVF